MAFGDISKAGSYAIAEASMIFNIAGGTMGDRFVLDPSFDNQLSITLIDKDNKKISGHFIVKLKRGPDDSREEDKTYIISANFNESYRVL